MALQYLRNSEGPRFASGRKQAGLFVMRYTYLFAGHTWGGGFPAAFGHTFCGLFSRAARLLRKTYRLPMEAP